MLRNDGVSGDLQPMPYFPLRGMFSAVEYSSTQKRESRLGASEATESFDQRISHRFTTLEPNSPTLGNRGQGLAPEMSGVGRDQLTAKSETVGKHVLCSTRVEEREAHGKYQS